jgi:hypothetical protein
VSTKKHYKKIGKPSSERKSQSHVVSHRIIFPKVNAQSTTTQQRKPSSNNSGDEGERNSPQGSLEKPHKLTVKRKRVDSQQEGEEQNTPENDIFLDDMDLYVDIENIWFPYEEECAQENVQSAALVVQDKFFSDEETFYVHNVLFDNSSKKLTCEITLKNNKGKS